MTQNSLFDAEFQKDRFSTLDHHEAFKYSLSHLEAMVVSKTDEEWKKQLEPQQYRVLRKKGTEPAFTGKYLHNKEKGIYVCAACGAELFSSDTKYDSGSGWPSFWTALAKDNIVEIPDRTLGMDRIEIQCKNCGGHLGHVFDDGPKPTGMRYCVNSLSLFFKKKRHQIESDSQLSDHLSRRH